ncbi:hypothetical protein OESDEN_01486 [Oesophagostomum dentatum]|uniref:Integrase catalytic domain-containing protein n=1 Tax=Oesophagostomum dentatum TaxID=61180 RepID=A0A0B1TQZ9_OESDE|nr:hypothetical protein OESDEN_01486 [Oesophagostomum dentatum]
MLVEAQVLNVTSFSLLLDSGAQASFITTSAAKNLGLRIEAPKPLTLVTFGGQTTTEASGRVKLTFVDSLDKSSTVLANTKDKLTHNSLSPQLTSEDIEFIKHAGFELPQYHRFHLDRFNAQRGEYGLIRCPARMENIQPTAPILLVPSHQLTKLITVHTHPTAYHQRTYGTIARLRARFFIPSVRRIVDNDNATTFHSVENAINGLLLAPGSWKRIRSYIANHRIKWKFITPVSPRKGGLYERLVALFKSAFTKAVGLSLLTFEQPHTIVVETEAVINSRPITPYRDNDASFHVLKPIDFISPEVRLQLPPKPQAYDFAIDEHRLANWYKETLTVLDAFWNIWHNDYLSALIQRHQRRMRPPKYTTLQPHVNDVVIIADDNLTRGQWKRGIVLKLITNTKGDIVRSAEVRTSKAINVRAINVSMVVKKLAQSPKNARMVPLHTCRQRKPSPSCPQERSSDDSSCLPGA